MRRAALLLTLLCPAALFGQGLKVPPAVQARPGQLVVLRAECPSDVEWRVPPEVQIDKSEGGRKLVLAVEPDATGKPRVFVLTAFAAVGQKAVFADCVLTVAPAAPPPPVDVFKNDLAALLAKDKSATADDRSNLAALYRQAAPLAEDEQIATGGQLLAAVRKATESKALKLGSKLTEVRRRVADEVGRVLPEDDALTGDARREIAAVYLRAAEAVGGGP